MMGQGASNYHHTKRNVNLYFLYVFIFGVIVYLKQIEALFEEHSQVQILDPEGALDSSIWKFLKQKSRVSVVSEQVQQKIQRTVAPFWQQRLISLENKEAILVKNFLLDSKFFLQSDLWVDDEALAKTHPEMLEEALELAFLTPKILDRSLLSLSNGELRRVLLMRMWMEKTEWVYFDDLFGGLDFYFRPILRESVLKMSHYALKFLIRTPRVEEIILNLPAFECVDGKFKPCLAQKLEAKDSKPRILPVNYEFVKLKEPNNKGSVLFDLEDIGVSFGKTPVIQNLTWKVYEGQHWVVMGENGAGKSTLLSLLSADHPQIYKNRVKLLGKVPGKSLNIWEHKEQLGFFSPEMALHFQSDWSVFDLLLSGFVLPFGHLKQAANEERNQVLSLCSKMGFKIPKVLFSELNPIEKRVLLILRAAIKKPRVLILDEPFQGMALQYRERILDLLDSLSIRSTLILVSHYQNEWPSCMTHLLKMPKFSLT